MNVSFTNLRERYVGFERAIAKLRSPLLLLIRIYWGWQFAQSGWGKLTNLSHVTQFFTTLHLPIPGMTAVLIAGLELVGGVLFIIGLASRGIATLLALDMIAAFLLADREALTFIVSDPGKFYAADPFTFLFASVLVAVFGAGMLSLDYLIAGRREVVA